MRNKRWKGRLAVLLAAGMLVVHLPAAAEEEGNGQQEAVQEENEQNNEGQEDNTASGENENGTDLTAVQETSGQEEGNTGEPSPAPASEETAPSQPGPAEEASPAPDAGEGSGENTEAAPAGSSEGSSAAPSEEAGSSEGSSAAPSEEAGSSEGSSAAPSEEAGSSEGSTPVVSEETSSPGESQTAPSDETGTSGNEGSGVSVPEQSSSDAGTQEQPENTGNNGTTEGSSVSDPAPVTSEAGAENPSVAEENTGAENAASDGQSVPDESGTVVVDEAPSQDEKPAESQNAAAEEKAEAPAKKTEKKQDAEEIVVEEEASEEVSSAAATLAAPPAQDQAASDAAMITTASVGVTWKDDNDANNIRPGFLTVYLQTSSDGTNYDQGTAYQLSAENGWQIRVEDLPSTKDGKTLHYRWVWELDKATEGGESDLTDDELDIVGYRRTKKVESDDLLSSHREYTHDTVKETYRIVIDWDTEGDSNAVIPESLDITLPDGRVVTVKASDGWVLDIDIPILHKDLVWGLSAADGWVSGGNNTDYNEKNTQITFFRKWKTQTSQEEITEQEEEEVPAGFSTLTVQFWIDGQQAADSFVGVYENGQNYNVAVPSITGYSAVISRVKGKITDDTTVNVRYVPNSYDVTVYYRYLNGETAAPTSTQTLKTGTEYSIVSPELAGYAVSQEQISGTVVGRNLTYVVYYTGITPVVPQPVTPEQPAPAAPVNQNGDGREDEQMIVMEIGEYETPLGLGEVSINAGECFE